MEVGTIISGLIALRARRFPFLTAPIAFSLWFMSMDVAPLLYGKTTVTGSEREWVSVGFGLVILTLAYLADLRGRAAAKGVPSCVGALDRILIFDPIPNIQSYNGHGSRATDNQLPEHSAVLRLLRHRVA
jgi:hypothetical protein